MARSIAVPAGWSVLLLLALPACGGGEVARSGGAVREDGMRSFGAWSAPVAFAEVNTPEPEFPGSISKDGLSFYFQRGNGVAEELWVVHRASRDEAWGVPERLPDTVNSAFNDRRPYVSADGHWLFFASDRPDGGAGGYDLWVSWRAHTHDDSAWEQAVNLDALGAPVNTAGFDSGPALFQDEELGVEELYFVANPTGPQAGADVYVSARSPDGSFGPPTLVAELSSPASDGSPYLSHDGREIYIQSNRAGRVGAQDLWAATRASILEPWSTPVNVAELNTTAPDTTPALSWRGDTLYFAIDGEIVVSTREKARGE